MNASSGSGECPRRRRMSFITRIERRRRGEHDRKTAGLPIPRGQRRGLLAIGADGDVMLRAAPRTDAAGDECVERLAAGASPISANGGCLATGRTSHLRAAHRPAVALEYF